MARGEKTCAFWHTSIRLAYAGGKNARGTQWMKTVTEIVWKISEKCWHITKAGVSYRKPKTKRSSETMRLKRARGWWNRGSGNFVNGLWRARGTGIAIVSKTFAYVTKLEMWQHFDGGGWIQKEFIKSGGTADEHNSICPEVLWLFGRMLF